MDLLLTHGYCLDDDAHERAVQKPYPPLGLLYLSSHLKRRGFDVGVAARAAGLGAALITLPLWSKFLARRALGLPWSISPCAVIPLGWPRGRYGPTTRRPVGEVVSLDRYGNRAFLAKA